MFEKIPSDEEKQYYRTLQEKVKSGDYVNACIPNQYPKFLKTFKGFMYMFEKMSKDKELGTYDLRVLMYLLGNVGFENWISITQENIASELEIKRPNIARTLKKLSEKNIISKEKVGRSNFYKVNPEFVWRGKTSKWKEVVDIEEFKKRQDEQYLDKKLPF